MVTPLSPGYGSPSVEQEGMMGDPMAMGQGPLAEIQPLVETYLSNPDPALADEIIMSLAASMGIAPPVAPAPAPEAGASPMPGGGMDPNAAPVPFEKGGGLKKILSGLKLK